MVITTSMMTVMVTAKAKVKAKVRVRAIAGRETPTVVKPTHITKMINTTITPMTLGVKPVKAVKPVKVAKAVKAAMVTMVITMNRTQILKMLYCSC